MPKIYKFLSVYFLSITKPFWKVYLSSTGINKGPKHAHFEINEIYRKEHEAVLAGDSMMACTYEQGLKTMDLIDNIRSYTNQWRILFPNKFVNDDLSKGLYCRWL